MQAARLATSTVGFLPPLALCSLWELKETHTWILSMYLRSVFEILCFVHCSRLPRHDLAGSSINATAASSGITFISVTVTRGGRGFLRSTIVQEICLLCIGSFLWSRTRADMLPHLYEINIQCYSLNLIKVIIIFPVNEIR